MSPAIIVMGPAGNGKSTLGQMLAARLGLTFVEGDVCHPPENIARMARGEALTDADRLPFLRAVAQAMQVCPDGSVAACSALRRAYRDLLRAELGDIVFVLPMVAGPELERRLADRPGHFMPASLIASQLDTLELPHEDEQALVLDGMVPPDQLIDRIVQYLATRSQHSAMGESST